MKATKKLKIMQGDVIAYTLDTLPQGARKTANKPIALGEIHGHAHVLTGDVERYEVNSHVIFLVKTMAILQHINIALMENKGNWETTEQLPVADHNPVTLPAGIYEFVIQNEYNPYKKIFQQVLD
jgi:hypothetical protein